MFAACLSLCAQRADYGKMSQLVRQIARNEASSHGNALKSSDNGIKRSAKTVRDGSLCAMVKITDSAEETLQQYGCTQLARLGSIYICDIPFKSLAPLSASPHVVRIEASRSNALCLDTASVIVNSVKVAAGIELPQAYTGKGVVLGIMDVGFDLTHPNFYDKDLYATRICRFWDQLSPDSLGSGMYVGADYRTPADILSYAHSHDSELESHGTHTLGIAAGTGYDTRYRGMAPEADICAVSNAVNTDLPLIPEDLLYRYTSATDVLGFKYIFDYANEMHQPCVVSFSEGSREMIDGEQQLLYEALAELTGPGRILVASAGNDGYYNTYVHKPIGTMRDGAFLRRDYGSTGSLTITADRDFSLDISLYAAGSGDKKTISTALVTQNEDSVLIDSVEIGDRKCVFEIAAYRSAFQPKLMAYDISITGYGGEKPLSSISFALNGSDADVKAYSNGIVFDADNALDPTLSGGIAAASIGSPAAAPSVICVGATAYRDSYVDETGVRHTLSWGKGGEVGRYSSVGPTRSGLVKPDVVAPGTYVYSSMNSFCLSESYAADIVSRSSFAERQYPWGVLAGTSQATPVVAGAIALWLEANPRLTTADILDVFSTACNRQKTGIVGEKDNHGGYGEIDVYAGMLKVLSLDGVKGISAWHPVGAELQYLGGRRLLISLKEGQQSVGDASISVYSLSGKLVKTIKLDLTSSQCDVSLLGLPRGVYAVQLNSGSKTLVGSSLIRL